MTPEEALFAILTGDATVSGILGDQVYPTPIPQTVTPPAIEYRRISSRIIYQASGSSRLAWVRLELTLHAAEFADLRALGDATRDALSGLETTLGGMKIRAVFLDSERLEWASVFKRMVIQQDYVMWYQEV